MPTCSTCDDTHTMTLGDRTVMCTRCPVPCQSCRHGGTGAYCTATPCACACHTAIVDRPAPTPAPAPGPAYCPPAGDAEHPAVQVVDVEPDLPPAFRLSVVLYGQHRLQPDEARAIARALHAAADAAEEK